MNHLEGAEVALEEGIGAGARRALKQKGRRVLKEANYGGGQAIMIQREYGALMGGSDPRKDGCAMGF